MQIYSWCRGWVPSHCFGSLFLALPILGCLSNFHCDLLDHRHSGFYLQVVFISLIHFSTLSSLNYVVKSLIATLFAIVVMLLYSGLICQQESSSNSDFGNLSDSSVHQQSAESEGLEGLNYDLMSEVVICILTLVLLVI